MRHVTKDGHTKYSISSIEEDIQVPQKYIQNLVPNKTNFEIPRFPDQSSIFPAATNGNLLRL